jgi:DNA-binding transcriptional LysR family regulator
LGFVHWSNPSDQQGDRWELRITMPSVLSQSGFMDQIDAFAETYSRITLSLDFSDTRRELIADGFDIAIPMGPKSKNSATSRTLFQVQRRLVASSAYLATRPKANDPTQLLDWSWLVLTPAQKVPVAFRKSDGKRLTIKPGARMNTNDA